MPAEFAIKASPSLVSGPELWPRETSLGACRVELHSYRCPRWCRCMGVRVTVAPHTREFPES